MQKTYFISAVLTLGILLNPCLVLRAAPQKKLPAKSAAGNSSKICKIRLNELNPTKLTSGTMVILGNSDKRTPIDTALAQNGTVEFKQPYTQDLLYIQINGKKVVDFFTDAPQVIFQLKNTPELQVSGEVNKKWDAYNKYVNPIMEEYYRDGTSEEKQKTLEELYFQKTKETFEANKTNPIGIVLMREFAFYWNARQLDSVMRLVPGSQNSQLISRIYQSKKVEEKTRPGAKFTDFKARNSDNSKEVALSDIVGHGQYVLADFWASWCGPCRHEFPYIRKAYDRYKDKGLIVLGINVWDKFPAYKESLTKFDLIWNHIYASDNRVATDTYGIAGIPHIILFGPDGTIIERGLHGEEMLKKLAEILK